MRQAVDLARQAVGGLVQRLQRGGNDVLSQLPKLAIYMGHVSTTSTVYYLQWIPEFTQAASARFEASYGRLVEAV